MYERKNAPISTAGWIRLISQITRTFVTMAIINSCLPNSKKPPNSIKEIFTNTNNSFSKKDFFIFVVFTIFTVEKILNL